MQLRNNREHANLQFIAYVNRGVMVNFRDGVTHEMVKVQEKPKYELIHVPPLATVIISDELWEAAQTGKVKRKVYKTEKTKIENLSQGKNKDVFKSNHVWTGEYKMVCPIQELVDCGDMTIVEQPKSTLSIEEKKTRVEATGMKLPKDADEEYIEKMYQLVR